MKRTFFVFAMLAFGLSSSAFAKHVAPQAVPPVFTFTLRIEAPVDDGKVGRIQAFDRTDGRLLWSLVVFKNRIYPWIEECVQWRFIAHMMLVGDTVEIAAEDGARYRVLLATRKVERLARAKKEADQAPEPTR